MRAKSKKIDKGLFFNEETGNYYIRVKYFGREFEKVIGRDKRAAEIALAEVKQEIRIAKHAGQGWDGFSKMQKAKRPKTFKEAAQDYIDERAHKKPSTDACYRSIVNHHLVPTFGSMPLSEISESMIRKFQSRLAREGLSESRVNGVFTLLRSILKESVRKGDLARDPSEAVRRLQEPKTRIDPLSDDDLREALSAVDQHYRPFYVVQAFTGARPNELQALRWSDIDWAQETISISKGRVRGKEGLPKTKSGERVIPMTPPVREALAELKGRTLVSLNDYVFTNKKGKPIDKHLDRIWARALKKAGIRHRASYQLRHTFVTQCIMKGLPLPYIAKVIGHTTIDTLIRHYLGWIDAASKEHDDKLKAAFEGKSQPTLMHYLAQKSGG